ncbi:hypothetical protein KQI42_15920 [Tissierella sp. MSJ-40]|uniref:Uncharacterized protein n=1 Tax=Tissierella simiarum TaxID=2841534 RepID=A0ABS6E994_9FIRM|nr:hypothetical protein [Tissierella simiarum]MBU5439503.1 hypothetical protein [Tissierella simiarum]
MADSTSVGKIQLDVEINQKSLNIEMNKLGKIFNNSFKNMFSGMVDQTNNFIKDSIGRISNSFKNFAQMGAGSSEKISKSVEKMNAQYEKTQVEIRKIQEELASLDAQRDAIINNYKDMPAFSGMSKDESLEKILKTDAGFQKLTAEIDKLTAKLNPLMAKNKKLADEIKNTGEEAENTGKRIRNLGKKSNKAGKDIDKASLKTKLFGDEMKRTGTKATGFAAMINRSFKSILKRIFVYNLILKGIRGIINYTSAALKTNQQFVHSLNIIKTNLMVAFQPIYSFILPALNALTRGVATATTYIAAAISALFGKTYQQSYNAAKNLDSTKKAMAGYGKAAKKAGKDAQGALMAFDEINPLDSKDKDDDSGGGAGDFEMTMPDLAAIDIGGIDKFKEIMASVFEPFVLAWENEGQNTINAMKYALAEIKELIKAIGNSWLEVWTGGTGQAILETTLRILQNIFGLIGDIAKATRLAWEENNLGTQLMQTIANAILNILGLIEQIGISWRTVWNNGTGQQIMYTILRILQNIFKLIGNIANSFTLAWTNAGTGTAIMQAIHDIIQSILDVVERIGISLNNVWGEVGNVVAQTFLNILRATLETLVFLGEKLVWVWDHGGQHLFEGFLKLGAKIFELAGYIYTEFVLPFIEWFADLMAPVIADLMEWVGKLLDKFTELIDWLLGDGKPVLDTIITVLKDMAIAFGIVKGAILIYNVVMGIATAVSTGFGAVMAFITSPIGLVTLAIGGIIAGLKLFGVTMDDIKNAVKKFVEGVVGFFHWLWDVLVGHSIVPDMVNAIIDWFNNLFEWVIEIVSNLVESIVEFFVNLWETITEVTTEAWNSLKEFLVELWNGLSESVTEIWTAISEFISNIWNSIKEKTSEIWNAIKTFLIEKIWTPIKNTAQTIWNNIKKVILDPIIQAKTSLEEKWTAIKKYILDKWNEIKQGISNMKDKLVDAIMNPFKIADKKIHDVIGSAKDWGRNLIQNFIDGIKAMIGKVKDAVKSVADTVADFLGFHSPSKKGPGSEADQWMPNLMGMLADGIEDNIYEVSAAVSMTAGSIQQGIQPNTDAMASAVGSAVLQSMQMAGSSQSQGDTTVEFNIDGATFARVVIPYLDSEKGRIGDPIIQPI